MKLIIDIPKTINDKIKIYRIEKEFKDREDVVLFVLDRYFNKEDGRGQDQQS